MPVNLGTAIGYLQLDITGFATSLGVAKGELNGFSKSVSSVEGTFNKVGKGLMTTGKVFTAGVTAPVVGIGAASVKTGKEFDAGMSRVKAITGDTTVDMKSLYKAAKDMGLSFKKGSNDSETAFNAVRAAAIKMGNDTKFTAKESTDALYYMGLAGWKADEQIAGLQGVLDLAAASGVDLGRTSDIVTDGLTAFGLSADKSTMFANALAAASANSNTNVDLLGESFKYVGPVAGGFGYTIQDTTLALGLMASAGVKGTQAGTGLRQMLVQLTKPSQKAAELMDKYKISLYDAQGNVKPFRDVITDLRSKFGGLDIAVTNADGSIKSGKQILEEYGKKLPITEQEKLTAITQIFGTRALPGVLSMINAGQGDFDQLANAIDGADSAFGGAGYAAGQAEIMLDNLDGDITKLTSKFGTTKIIISDLLKGELRSFVQKLGELLDKFNKADPATQKMIVKIALIAAAIGPLLIILGGLITTITKVFSIISTIKTIITVLGPLIGGLVSAFGPWLIVIAAVIAIGVLLYKNWDKIKEVAQSLWEKIKEVFGAIKDFLVGVWQTIIDKTSSAWETIKNVVKVGLLFIKELIITFGKIVTLPWQFIWVNFGKYLSSAWESIKKIVSTALTALSNTIKAVWNGIKSFLDPLWNGIKSLASTVFNGIKSIVTTAFTTIKNHITAVWNGIKLFITPLLNTIKNTFSTVFNGIKNTLTTIFDSIKKVVSNAIDFVSSVISKGLNKAKSVVTSILDPIKKKFTDIFSGIQNVVKKAIDYVKDKFDRLKLKLPHIDLPHFSISGSFGLNPPSVPSFNIDWYKKAMRNGIIMNEPTIFGYDNTTGKFLAGGEAGSEVVVGTMSLLTMIKNTVVNAISGLLDSIHGYAAAMLNAFSLVMSSMSNNIDRVSGQLYNIIETGNTGINYDLLASKIVEIFRMAPIENNVTVEMQDGDIYIDGERAGRKLAPIISRIIATG